ncbi:TPA: hypothetical protein ACGO1T_000526 [Streptococcus suis]
MAEKNYVRLDKVSSTAHYETIISSDSELIGGMLVNLGGLLDGNREAVEFTKATEDDTFEAIVVPVYLNYGSLDFNLTTQSIPAGKPARVLIPENGAIISINKELVSGDPTKGDKVTVGASGKGFKKVESSEKAVGTVLGTEFQTNVGELVVIRINK